MQRFFVARGMVVIGLGIFSLLVSVQDAFATALDRDSSSFVTEQAVTLEPDLRTGSFVYSYPFTLAPGRNGLQPSLSLNYNSANSDVSSIVGYGWSLSVPSIERVNRYGVDDLYTSTTFSSSLSGELEDVSLTDTTHGAYGAKIDDGSFLTYSYGTDETWTVTDKHGMTYVFGAFDDDRLSDPSDTTRVFRWMLSEVRDGNDNVVTYSYQKNGNQIYPLAINYTGNGSAAGIFDVGFSLETRADVAESFAAGFSVETAYRLSGIDVEVNGQARRSYELVYTTGDNGTRSLLQSITETAFDEDAASLTKPATTFDYSTADRSWSEDASFAGLPVTIAGTGNGSLGVYLFDVNGDNLPDVVKARYGGDHAVYINNGDYTWTEDSAYAIPFDFAGPVGQDMGVRVADMDGDGFLDLLYSRTGGGGFAASALYLNNGDGTGWSEDTSVTIPLSFSYSGSDLGVRIVDIDGDGMQDLVKARDTFPTEVYINNGDGTGWTSSSAFNIPQYFTGSSNNDRGVRFGDVNGDGLTDLVYGRYTSTTETVVYINTGDGWSEDTNYTVPRTFLGPVGQDFGLRLMDMNADGLTDLVYSRYIIGTGVHDYSVYVNNGDGTGWSEDTTVTVPMWFTTGSDRGVRELDVDGDGLDDILYSREISGSPVEQLWLADGEQADSLIGVVNFQGGSTEIAYESEINQGGELFFPMRVVSSVMTDDGLGNTSTTSYDYADGDYYYADEYDRKFAGFGAATATDGAGNESIQYFHQGNDANASLGESTDDVSKLWKMYREESYDSAAQLYRTVIHSWTNDDLGDGRDFVYQDQALELLYDADSDHRDKATTYTFDAASGNLSEKKDWAQVTGTDAGSFSDVDGSDNVITSYTYAAWTSGGTSGYPTAEIVRDYWSNRYRHTRWFYDNEAFGYVTTGNMTDESRWVVGSTSLDTTYTYDSYGFVATKTDPLSQTTTFTPDADKMYIATQTDALGYATSFEYDYSFGNVKQKTDQNGNIFETDYDGFGRPTAEWQPDPDAPTSLVQKTAWEYDDTSVPASIHQTDYFDETLT